MTKLHHILATLQLGLLMVVTLASCSGEEEIRQEEVQVPINFASIADETEAVTRANTTLGRNFVVYGYKNAGGTEQTVFDGYKVNYLANSAGTSEDNTHNYYYVGIDNQTLKYWDFSASEYHFWGATGGTFNRDGTELTISNLEQSVSEPDVTGKMFSSLYHRSPVTRDVVQLHFKRPYAKVRILFYCSDALDVGDVVEIGTSTFGPEATGKIITGATLKVMYAKSGDVKETYLTESTATSDKLNFGGVALTHLVGTASNNAVLAKPTDGTEYYYVVPYEYAEPFILNTKVEGDPKTAVVPATLMQWKPNYVYTYIFKITEAGKKIEFYDVKIDPWKYGGSQNEEWKNW